ncbi:NADPH-dependent FMN reductase [Nakamurella aerolata]|uniref:NAD(P)H-dependent oxidoreductase n=1 Tax=Nakamurella aerolata TaxID=1656892 RepID=A0A849A366_9ACTN|nr:NAD(P)H-dependent oxidoreductase [Nakamurella aerolata]NNG35474.1 NAD(P)H-dependent oxidoreductase [Nakamurella aerolata]
MAHILLVVGSTRPVRVGDQLAEQIAPLLSEGAGLPVRVVDLAELDLPLLNEPVMAGASIDYAHEHTKAWSELVKDAEAVVFLTPQYNSGYPAGLKNAIDYLYVEWQAKPALIVSYGAFGGGMGGAQLRAVTEFVKMRMAADNVEITIPRDAYVDWRLADPAAVVAPYREQLTAAGPALGKDLVPAS